MEPKLITDPSKIGPGYWQIIHFKARNSDTLKLKQDFIDFMYLLSVEFPCGNCRNHIQKYLKENPFEPFMNLKNEHGEDIGMFKWSWLFHNAVNIRIHKPYVDWDTAWEMYNTNKEICTDCGIDSIENKKKKEEIIRGYFLKKH